MTQHTPAEIPATPPRPLRPLQRMTRLATAGLVAWIALNVAMVPVRLWLIAGYSDLVAGPDSVAAAQRLQELAIVDLLLLVPVVVGGLGAGLCYLVWLYRARDNAELLSPVRHRRSRAWLTLGWIVPVVNLWFPYQIVRGIWTASVRNAPAPGIGDKPGVPLLAWWWGLYLAYYSVFLWPTGDFSWSFYDTGISQLARETRFAAVIDLLALPFGILAAVLAIRVVRKISAGQTRAD